jgi:hypothetical protein
MYGRYVYTAAATLNNVIDDIAAILTGQTNSSLLAAAVIPDTELDGTIPTTWSVYDNATGSDNPRVILRSAISDAGSKYKFIGLGSNAGSLVVYSYEDWNTSTNTGTNAVSVTWAMGIGSSKQITLHANSKAAYVSRPAVDETTAIAGAVVTEFDRWDIWRTTGAAYPDAVLCYAGSGWGTGTTNGAPTGTSGAYVAADRCKAIRVKNGNAAGDLTAQSSNWAPVHMAASIHNAGTPPSFPAPRVRSADETVYHPTSPMIVGSWGNGFLGGMMSPYADVYWSTRNVGNNFVEMVVDSKTYVVNIIDANSVLLIRKN